MAPSRIFHLAVAIFWLVTVSAAHAGQTISVLKTSGCGCCLAWIKYLERSGFVVEARNVAMGDLMQTKLDAGLKPELAACHTARIEGYVVEGHVPVREIRRLLDERPDAIGLAVPGMPVGSPGMEADKGEPYQVLLVRKDGSTEVFAQYQ
jgi:hypothetical protein